MNKTFALSFKLLIGLLSGFLFSLDAFACMCVKESVASKFHNFPFIFHAQGAGEQFDQGGVTLTNFKVIKNYKGRLVQDQVIRLNTEKLTSCEGPTASKEEWIIFAYYNENDLLTANKCGVLKVKQIDPENNSIKTNPKADALIKQLESLSLEASTQKQNKDQ